MLFEIINTFILSSSAMSTIRLIVLLVFIAIAATAPDMEEEDAHDAEFKNDQFENVAYEESERGELVF